MAHRLGHESRLAAPIGDFRIGEAEMSVSVVLAQKFERMWREIDDHQPSRGPHHARRLGNRERWTVGVMQDLMENRRIEALIGERQLKDVALADRAIVQIRLLEIGARDREHFARQIDTDRALDARRYDFQHAAGAGAKIEQIADRVVTKRLEHRSLDFALIDGHYRDYSARFILAKVKPGGMLIIDNANWSLPCRSKSPNSRNPALGPATPTWAEVAEELSSWRPIWTSSGVWDTAIFIKPADARSEMIGG